MGQQICIPRTPKGKYQDDAPLRQLSGYNNIQQTSILEWREEKLKNNRKNLGSLMVDNWMLHKKETTKNNINDE